jgi:hypothetical protein
MVRIRAALVGIVLLAVAPSAFAQTPAEPPAEAAPPAEPPAETDDTDRVIVTGEFIPDRNEIYRFYQELTSNDFCPPWLVTPRGHSCAEVTYDIFDADGKHLGKCNVPIFRLYRFEFDYMAVTYDKFDCSAKKTTNRNLTIVMLQELFDPRTKDGTIFRKVGVMGSDQARELCKVSSDLCVMELFDRESELSYCALKQLWGLTPPPDLCARR